MRCAVTTGHRRELEMMLKDEVAVIYGAGGAVGAAVARAFARQRRPRCSGRNCFAAASVVISEGTHQHAVVDSSSG
jgi:NAD(P)-dependent dehydrogenase (short-subunit alcohol dehydrogenase family)